MNSTRPVYRIGIAAYPLAQKAAVYGLQDLFETASRFEAEHTSSHPQLLCDIIEDFNALKPEQYTYTTIILPPSLDGGSSAEIDGKLLSWITQQHEKGTLMCSVCAGAFPLAASGLLDNRRATTHWALTQSFKDRFPNVKLDPDRLIIDDGDIITAGGVMAWTDLGLKLIARFLGPAIMLETARYFLIDPGEREQSYYNLFSPNLSHGDTAILKAQHWLQAQYSGPLTVPEMASTAGLEERTFVRRFLTATGLNPSKYLQNLRIAKARELLELSPSSIEHIAMQVGYFDISAFRKLFHKIVGLTPRDYRNRFSQDQVKDK
ncbi:GlxA family transcriptional regulator [Flexibacterium corallicola]|uniref:GlxA family transcriptional regulator n=1 Tax=Flexibacterium corallicola TaxID=3037259 RepID=UPI00286F81DA|nr:GlxA family transcriptional regulator [Pseudovibrio sp. M1P-2-3]